SSMASGTGISSGTATTTSTPVYHYSRAVAFEARLSDPQTSRKFWVVSGQTKSGGSLFMGAPPTVPPPFSTSFQTKGLIGPAGPCPPAASRRRGLSRLCGADKDDAQSFSHGQVSYPEQNERVTEAAGPSHEFLPAISNAASGSSSINASSSY